MCKGFPNEFADYINYTRNLEFEADPDYKYIRGLLLSVLEKEKQSYDFCYDWLNEKPEINDNVAIERYMKKNYSVSLELSEEDKKGKEDNNHKENENEKENNMNFDKYASLNTANSNTDNNINNNNEPRYNSQVVKTNDGGINVSVGENNITSNSVGKNEESLDKKDGKKSKDKKNKKDKKDRGCLIY